MSDEDYFPQMPTRHRCDASTTHFQGCKCHEARHAAELAAKDARIKDLEEAIKVQRDALLHIREEPNRMGLMADELVEEYNLTAWYDADAALARVAKILGGGE